MLISDINRVCDSVFIIYMRFLLDSELWWWPCDAVWDSRGFMWGVYVSIASFCLKASSLRRLANQLYTRTSVTRLDPSPWALEGDTPLCTHSALNTTHNRWIFDRKTHFNFQHTSFIYNNLSKKHMRLINATWTI